MFCPKCGQQNSEDSSFCRSCGTALAVAAPMPGATGQHYVANTTQNAPLSVPSLVLGLIGLFISPLAILAIIFGAVALGKINNDPSLKGKGMAVAGLVLGIVEIASWVLVILIFGAFLSTL